MAAAPDAPRESPRRDRRWLARGCCAAFIVAIGALGWLLEPYVSPERYIPTIERTSLPLIQAIDRYKADHGWPPEHEAKLLPAYLERMPETGYRGCSTFFYSCRRRADDTHIWRLIVYCDPPMTSVPSTIEFDSDSRAWRYHP